MRTKSGWADIRILNVSSRGLLIQAPRLDANGGTVELRHGDQTISAKVIWRDGARIGLRAEDRIPLEQILAFGQSTMLQLVAGKPAKERRQKLRYDAMRSRIRGRALEFLSIAVIAACVGLTLASAAREVLARPLAAVRAALNG